MITISDAVEDLIKVSPFLEEALSEGIVNLSALARIIKPGIEKKMYKKIEDGAIIMALKRLDHVHTGGAHELKLQDILKNLGDITVRSNIVSFTFANSPTLTQNQAVLLQRSAQVPDSFLTITDGIFETSLFMSANLAPEIGKIFTLERIKSKLALLSSITITIPEEATFVPGVYYSILKKLAWEGINFIDIVSSYTELTIFLDDKDIKRAFAALKD